MKRVGEEIAIHWDRLSVDLVRPTTQHDHMREKTEKG